MQAGTHFDVEYYLSTTLASSIPLPCHLNQHQDVNLNQISSASNANFQVQNEEDRNRGGSSKPKTNPASSIEHKPANDEPNLYLNLDGQRSGLMAEASSHLTTTKTTPRKAKKNSTRRTDKIQSNNHPKNGVGSHPCPQCGRTFGFKTNLLTHMRIHTGERPFKCTICSYSAAHKCNLVTHMNIHTGSKPHKCEYCNQEFRARPNLIVHIRQHTRDLPFKCDTCECSFASQGAMKGHVLRHHYTGKIFECPLCDKKFRQQAHLNTHIGRHDQDVRNNSPPNPDQPNGRGKFECDICREQFATNRDRRRHALTHTVPKTHNCTHCTASFENEDQLEIHLLIH